MRSPPKSALDEAVHKTLYALFNDALKMLSVGANQQRKAARMDELVKHHLLRVLDACGQNQTHASQILGIDRRTLQRNLESILSPNQKAMLVTIKSASAQAEALRMTGLLPPQQEHFLGVEGKEGWFAGSEYRILTEP